MTNTRTFALHKMAFTLLAIGAFCVGLSATADAKPYRAVPTSPNAKTYKGKMLKQGARTDGKRHKKGPKGAKSTKAYKGHKGAKAPKGAKGTKTRRHGKANRVARTKRMMTKFDALDRNSDGRLTGFEMRQANERLQRRLLRADTNGDGIVTKSELRTSKSKRGRGGAKGSKARGKQGAVLRDHRPRQVERVPARRGNANR